MSKLIAFVIVAFSLLLSSCATLDGPKYNEVTKVIESGKSRIVVYRDWSLTGAAWPSHFYIDGNLFAELNNSGFSYIDVLPGKHQVSTGPKENPTFESIEIAVEEGVVYFVRLIRGMPDIFGQVPSSEANRALNSGEFRLQILQE